LKDLRLSQPLLFLNMYLVNVLEECISHIEKGEFDPVLNDAINGLRVYVDEKTRNIEVAVAASVTPTPSRSEKRKLPQTQHTHQDSSSTTKNKNSEETVIPDTQEDISNKRPKTHINTISPSSSSISSPQSQFFDSEDTSWNQRLSEMKSYIHRNKGTLELDIDKMGPELFIWTYTQSTMYKSNLLSESRKSELAKIDEFVMFSNAEPGGFETINNEVNNDNDMNHQSTDQELQVNDTLQPLEASIEIEEPANDIEHEDNNISTTNQRQRQNELKWKRQQPQDQSCVNKSDSEVEDENGHEDDEPDEAVINQSSSSSTKKLTKRELSWKSKFEELRRFKQLHEHTNVPKSKKQLNNWVNNQRSEYKKFKDNKKSYMTPERIEKLESIGFEWECEDYESVWNKRFNELKEYKEKYGRTNVPQNFKDNKQLGTWVHTQRSEYKKFQEKKKSSMTPERIQTLGSIGFQWSCRPRPAPCS